MRNWRNTAMLPVISRLLLGLCGVALFAQIAAAAPERLGDNVPDATPDPEGAWSVSWAYENLALEGPLTDSTVGNSYYKLRYQFSPDVNAAVFYRTHSLGGDLGLTSPLLDGADSASGYGVDLGINLLNVEAIPASPDGQVAWTAGSSFGVGLTLERLNLSLDNLDQDDSLMRAYLVYSTDLSERLRAHTYFSTGRVSGDSHTGSWNRVSGGLDYALTHGERPLTLMANAILDIYNFRRPTFNTSRISRFDVGLRYEFQPGVNASLGWATLNDSENDASGSGLFASLQYTDLPSRDEDGDIELVAEIPASETPVGPPAESPSGPPPVQQETVAAPTETPAEQPAAVPEPQPGPTPDVPIAEPATPTEAQADEQVISLPDARADSGDSRSVSSANDSDREAFEQPPLMNVEPVIAADPTLTLEDEQVDQVAAPPATAADKSVDFGEDAAQQNDLPERRVSSGVLDSLADEFAESAAADDEAGSMDYAEPQNEGDQTTAAEADTDFAAQSPARSGGIEIPELSLLPPADEDVTPEVSGSEYSEAESAEGEAEKDPEADQVVSVDTVPAEEIQED